MNSISPSFNSQCKDTTFMWNKHKKEAWNMKCFTFFITSLITKKMTRNSLSSMKWALTDSNRRPSACKADALNQLS